LIHLRRGRKLTLQVLLYERGRRKLSRASGSGPFTRHCHSRHDRTKTLIQRSKTQHTESRVDFSLNDEEKAIRETARTFMRKDVMPLEDEVLRRERQARAGPATRRTARTSAQGSGVRVLGTVHTGTVRRHESAGGDAVADLDRDRALVRALSGSAARRTTSCTCATRTRRGNF
jgi:hypothetical protein